MIPVADILRTPYSLEVDEVGIGLSCLGVVREYARRRGIPRPPDGWPSIREDWLRGRVDNASGFPVGWVRLPVGVPLQDLDVLVYVRGGRPGCAIVDAGMVLTSEPGVGAHLTPLARWTRQPAEVWRWAP